MTDRLKTLAQIVWTVIKKCAYRLYLFLIPQKKDPLRQILLKCGMLLCLAALIVSLIYLFFFSVESASQRKVVDHSRKIWHDQTVKTEEKFAAMIAENPDFRGWITVSGTKIDNPFYQCNDDDFYLTHNQLKEKSKYGAVFLSCLDTIDQERSDKNLVIYGHDTTDGSMFGTLHYLRRLGFYQQNPVINLSTRYEDVIYKIYAIMVLNATTEDDNGRIYNITTDYFSTAEAFDAWLAEARQRSLINTTVDVVPEDEILSLVTCCYDFENARLVVMARRVRDGEDPTVDTASARENKSARFPKKWYEVKKKEYPYAAEGISVQDVPSASSELSGSSEPVGEQPPGPAENGSNQAPSAEAASGSTGSSEEPNGFAP